MSADNFGVIAQHPLSGKWYVLVGFTSDDEFFPNVRGPGHPTREAAKAEAATYYFEYGYSQDAWPDSWQEFCDVCGGWAERWLEDGDVYGLLGKVTP